jgi:hypothetical protein
VEVVLHLLVVQARSLVTKVQTEIPVATKADLDLALVITSVASAALEMFL